MWGKKIPNKPFLSSLSLPLATMLLNADESIHQNRAATMLGQPKG